MNAQITEPLPLEEVLRTCTQLAEQRGIAVLVPGDVHLWGKRGGNRSGTLHRILSSVPFRYLLTNGDLFDGMTPERETPEDKLVLDVVRTLDSTGRWIPIRGNHDRRVFREPSYVAKRSARKFAQRHDVDPAVLAWLPRVRTVPELSISVVEGEAYRGPAHPTQGGEDEWWSNHPGTHDLIVLSLAGRNILFEHGDAHDRLCGSLGAKQSIMSLVGSGVYNAMVAVEQTSVAIGTMSGQLKRRFSMWRGVCEDVAVGATRWAEVLDVPIHGTVSGHTHYPLHTDIDGIPHVNVGSFRGRRPSFAIITEDGELLPPFIIRD